MKGPLNEAVEMRLLLSDANRLLAEAEDIAAGRKARIILANWEGETRACVVSFRAARYARRAMGAPTLLPESPLQAVFSSRGITVSLRPTAAGYDAIADAIIAYQSGEIRRINRLLGKNKRQMREMGGKPAEGGAEL